MPRIQTIICSGVIVIASFTATAQTLPKNPTIQQVVGYQQYQQRQWNLKQLPANSVLYQYHSRYSINHVRNTFIDLGLNTRNHSSSLAYLHSYLDQKKEQNILLQKQGWWKDPSKGTISSFLKDFLYNKSYIHQ